MYNARMAKDIERFHLEIKKNNPVKQVSRNLVEALKRWGTSEPVPTDQELKQRLEHMTKHPEELEIELFNHRFPPIV